MLTLTAPGDREHRMPSGKVCRCTPAGGINVGEWNANAGQRWNRFCQELRRRLGAQVQYFKATEVQARGALHFHVLIRVPQGRELMVVPSKLRGLAIRYGFGHEVDVVQVLDERASWYVSKYASKSAGQRESVPWVDRQTGEVGTRASYRTWTASRAWGMTMRALRAQQALWWSSGGLVPQPPPGGEDLAPLDTNTDCYTSTLNKTSEKEMI